MIKKQTNTMWRSLINEKLLCFEKVIILKVAKMIGSCDMPYFLIKTHSSSVTLSIHPLIHPSIFVLLILHRPTVSLESITGIHGTRRWTWWTRYRSITGHNFSLWRKPEKPEETPETQQEHANSAHTNRRRRRKSNPPTREVRGRRAKLL